MSLIVLDVEMDPAAEDSAGGVDFVGGEFLALNGGIPERRFGSGERGIHSDWNFARRASRLRFAVCPACNDGQAHGNQQFTHSILRGPRV